MKKLFAVLVSVLLLAACATQRQDVAAINAKIATVTQGDYGQFLYHQSLAEENLAELRLIRQYRQDDHYWNINMDADANRSTENALKHKKMAEEALMHWHDSCTRHQEICHRVDEVETWWQHHKGKQIPIAFFDTASAVPKSLQQAEIDKILHLAKDHPGLPLDLIGYADTVGTHAYNKRLSEKRAQAIEKILVKQGLSKESKVRNIAFGEAPGPDNTPDEKNRRVDVHIHHGEKHHGEKHH